MEKLLHSIMTTPELWSSIVLFICGLVIIYILLARIKDYELSKIAVIMLVIIIVVVSGISQHSLREQIQPVYVDLPEEWPAIDTNGTDTLLVSLSPNKDTLYTSFLIQGFTDSEVEEEVHNRKLKALNSHK
jgi:hypothetical protein